MRERYSFGFAAALCGMLMGILPFQSVAIPQPHNGDFFRTNGSEILNPAGESVVIRGVGLGGWLMPEGYMLQVPGYGSPTSIRAKITDLIGVADTKEFYRRYRLNYVAEKDIAAIAGWGFDHIRLPFHYDVLYDLETRTFKEDGFVLFDQFLGWCKKYGLAVILDMHAAPGGQNPHNISDSDGTARLWTEPGKYQPITIEIWKEIVRRYKDDTIVIGYDLLNEPVLPDGVTGFDLRDFYIRLTDEVRSIDRNHIIFIEGNWFATDFTGLAPPFDDNMVYAFHKYWNSTGRASIDYLLRLRSETNTPLWLGESGENSNDWFYETTRMVEAAGIGWNWWTHKKIDTITSPLSAPIRSGYQTVLDYWNGAASRPSAEFAREALFAMADGLAFASCVYRLDVVSALFDEDFGETNRPYADHSIPGIINAVDYDIGANGVSYRDVDYKRESGSIGNRGWRYRNDGVDIHFSPDPHGFDYAVGWIEDEEWLRYTVNIETAGTYRLDMRVVSPEGRGAVDILLDDRLLVRDFKVSPTGGSEQWHTLRLNDLELPMGIHELTLRFGEGGFDINRLAFILVRTEDGQQVEESEPVPFRLVGRYPNPVESVLNIALSSVEFVSARLEVFDSMGRSVVVDEHNFSPGRHELTFDPGHLSSGQYLFRLKLSDGDTERFETGAFTYIQ